MMNSRRNSFPMIMWSRLVVTLASTMMVSCLIASCKFMVHSEVSRAEIKGVFDRDHALMVMQDPNTRLHYFAVCGIRSGAFGDIIDTYEDSCVNAFRLQDDTEAFFKMTTLEQLSAEFTSVVLRKQDMEALERLQKRDFTLMKDEERDRLLSWSERSQQFGQIGMYMLIAGYGLDLIQPANEIAAITRTIGVLTMVAGIGHFYFMKPASVEELTLKKEQEDSGNDLLSRNRQSTRNRRTKYSAKSSLQQQRSEVMGKYDKMHMVVDEFPAVMKSDYSRSSHPIEYGLVKALGKYFNLYLFHPDENFITRTCVPVNVMEIEDDSDGEQVSDTLFDPINSPSFVTRCSMLEES
ncbi:MAG: hypothetical protein OXC40_01960 [Proteobacteria bacterium]|nr:hypothetical protein [Pseudomonadota bacterium]